MGNVWEACKWSMWSARTAHPVSASIRASQQGRPLRKVSEDCPNGPPGAGRLEVDEAQDLDTPQPACQSVKTGRASRYSGPRGRG